jgi:hypothetical protein
MRDQEWNPNEEWTDGELAEYPAGHGPITHVTSGIQEAYSLNSYITGNPKELERGHANPENYKEKHQ